MSVSVRPRNVPHRVRVSLASWRPYWKPKKYRWRRYRRPSLNRSTAAIQALPHTSTYERHTINRNHVCGLLRRLLYVNLRFYATLSCSGGRLAPTDAAGTVGLRSRWRMVVGLLRVSSLASLSKAVRFLLPFEGQLRRRHIGFALMLICDIFRCAADRVAAL